jgi:hypothetical protein
MVYSSVAHVPGQLVEQLVRANELDCHVVGVFPAGSNAE